MSSPSLKVPMIGREFPSELQPGVRYRLEEQIGSGGMGAVFLATRTTPVGASLVVVKVVHAEFVATGASTAALSIQKEVVALGRLDEQVPPTPFVVRFIDTGQIEVQRSVSVPWLAIEYVHGGAEGTTLRQRLDYALQATGMAFGAERAAHLVRCLASGLTAIHEVGVVHRDLSPGNVLACGFGESEIFKISDFGLARPVGLSATFGSAVLGTPGYAAPEQTIDDQMVAGPHTDVFSLACLLYLALTGEPYFPAGNIARAIFAVKDPTRRSITEGRALAPELRADVKAVRGIDQALAAATAFDVASRPATAEAFAALVLPHLGGSPRSLRPSVHLLHNLVARSMPPRVQAMRWTVRLPPGGERVIYSVGWDGDGHCVAATSEGLGYWDGERWSPLSVEALRRARGVRVVRRLDAGEWLLGSSDGTLVHLSGQGAAEVVRSPDPEIVYQDASGRPGDLLVALCRKPGAEMMLMAMAARRWMKPLPLPGVAHVAALERLDDHRWILCGRKGSGLGFVAICEPMQWSLAELPVPSTRAFVACSTQPERQLACVAGTAGHVLRVAEGVVESSLVPGGPDLSAVGLDLAGTEWVATLGTLWSRPAGHRQWHVPWSDAHWQVPFASLVAEYGHVFGMTVDGGVIEGRSSEAR